MKKTHGDQNPWLENVCIENLMSPEQEGCKPYFADEIRSNRRNCELIEHAKGINEGIVLGGLSVLGGFVVGTIIKSMIKK